MNYLIVDGDGAQAVEKEQQRWVHVMKEVSGLMALRTQRKDDFSGPPVRKKINARTINTINSLEPEMHQDRKVRKLN